MCANDAHAPWGNSLGKGRLIFALGGGIFFCLVLRGSIFSHRHNVRFHPSSPLLMVSANNDSMYVEPDPSVIQTPGLPQSLIRTKIPIPTSFLLIPAQIQCKILDSAFNFDILDSDFSFGETWNHSKTDSRVGIVHHWLSLLQTGHEKKSVSISLSLYVNFLHDH